MDEIVYIDYEIRNIQGKEYIAIHLYDLDKFAPIVIFKLKSDSLTDRLDTDYERFMGVSERITYDIKRNGKISLDIKI